MPHRMCLLLFCSRYFALPCLENLLEAPNGSFADVYAQQSSQLEAYIAAQPFQVCGGCYNLGHTAGGGSSCSEVFIVFCSGCSGQRQHTCWVGQHA